jgi:hypothetical protein
MAFLAQFQVSFELGHPAFLLSTGDGDLLLRIGMHLIQL